MFVDVFGAPAEDWFPGRWKEVEGVMRLMIGGSDASPESPLLMFGLKEPQGHHTAALSSTNVHSC